MIIATLALLSATLAAPAPPQALWEAWPRRRLVDTPAACLKHAELVSRLHALAAKHPGRARVEEVGRSSEGRPIHMLAVGGGERHVLLWSQMHGDEPSATPALLDTADYLLSDAGGRAVLDALTLLMVPMLNPDGTERGSRRNAQGIDVNRDALNLATPEGRVLKAVRDRYQPILGFNLHDQDRRTTVGDSGRLATIALLAVAGTDPRVAVREPGQPMAGTDPRVAVREPGHPMAGDPRGTMTTGRLRARRIAAAVVAALEPFVGGSIARYDEDWSPRAFGDNITAWGTPVVLVESGGLPPGRPLSDLTRLNFVALVSVLSALAADDAAGSDPAVYERLTRNRSDAYADVVLRGGRVLQGAVLPYRADVAFDVHAPDARAWACAGAADSGPSAIVEIGDARFLTAGREVDASGKLIVPALVASVRGYGARWWLTPEALAEIARLGVGTLRWHVPLRHVGPAQIIAAQRSAAGRPVLSIVGGSERASQLVLTRAPRRARSRSLADTLDALGAWRAKGSFAALLPLLTAPPSSGPAPTRLTRDAPASLLLLRGSDGGDIDPAALEIDAVYIDGRELE